MRLSEWFARHRVAASMAVGTAAFVVLCIAILAVAAATDRPSFCRTCHEMTPYHDAWSSGPHADVSCVECHVDNGPIPRLLHKFVALGEVVSHVRGDTSFPRTTRASVPDERCERCHERVKARLPGFDHALHARRGPCVKCHATTGHSVSIATLKAAGIFSGKPAPASRASSDTVAVMGGGKADLTGHVTVSCSKCHLMSKTRCSACHEPPHSDRGECGACHKTGSEFRYAHPLERDDCQTCHTKGPTHTTIKGSCSGCHTQPGVAWSFIHPPATAKCTTCHARPADHRAGLCSQCHATGSSWAFTHPRAGSSCGTCHARPAGHASGECSVCHGLPGSSWAFRHPTSSKCASCHRAPANHYGSSCASCHSASRAWRNATFRHAAIPGGEHTYRSFACAECHPGGYSRYSCTKCHDANGDDGEDDD